METLLSALLSGAQTGAIYALIGLGYVAIFRSSGYLVLTQGEMVMVGGMIAAGVGTASVGSLALALLASVAATAAITVAVYLGPIRLMRDPSPLRVIILTFGAALVIRSLARHGWGAVERFSAAFPGLPQTMSVVYDRAVLRGQAVIVVAVLVLAVVGLVLWFSRTSTGRAARAAGDDRVVAGAMGIPTVAVVALAFALAGGLGGLAGALAVPITGIAWNQGTMLGLKGLVAALAGGIEHPVGPVVGGLLLGLAEQLASVYVVAGWNDAVAFAVLVLAVLVRARGPLEART